MRYIGREKTEAGKPAHFSKEKVREAIQEMIAFGKGRKLGDVTIKQLINEGRRR
jgi:hypothetical protein